ncbi:BamA/TamA family outer membrane protein [uncultured Duncaniella sp.]|uniref:translocation and assembly module lipoprotein TamL n=10 Tax=uncultured Duncaniella sp. TaxID=2768039 RepID=UPI0026706BC6|nr:BamA/TamA family outer membrane protein [uncultured Duncaniella sp.]
MRNWLNNALVTAGIAVSLLLEGCSAVRHVPEGRYLLDKVNISVEGDKDIPSADLYNYLRQTPNHKVLGFWKLQLGTYNLSGNDSTKWYNRWVRRMGQPPVIYEQALTDASARQLHLAMINRGYLNAHVEVDTTIRTEKRRIDVRYNIFTGEPHVIRSVTYDIPDSAVASVIMADSTKFTVKTGDKFDRDNLDSERTLITRRLRNRGYYAFNKDYITYYADTAANSRSVDLTMAVRPPRRPNGADTAADSAAIHTLYRIGKVYFITDSDGDRSNLDTVSYKGVDIVYGRDRYLKPGALEEKCFLIPGQLYSPHNVDRTYESIARLGILKSINIELVPEATLDNGDRLLDAYIRLSRNKKQSITLDIEGTNSEGDLGFGVGATYQHRNLAKGSQLFTGRLRMNYESLSGSFNGLINDRYTEYAGEVGITFPRFEFPFAPLSMRQRFNVSSEFALSFNYQERPEYTRIISGAAWRYKWVNRTNTRRHEFDLIDINYVYLPARTNGFLDAIAPDNPLLRYSYEDHFIMSMGYRYYHTNKRIASAVGRRARGIQPIVYTIRASAETAGNLLYLGSKAFGKRSESGVYEVFNTQFSQYIKGEVDYAITRNFDHRHSLAFHIGGGIGYPYGNSRVLPFEKRFYAGGANGVRGWGVRTLGPGRYNSHNSVSYFINQCGDIRLDMSLEYRAKLFWVLEGGAFIDAGNIWTIHNYENQPGGMFHFNTFWKEIAWAYGLGLRMDFNYFLLRLDLGVKAYNPAQGQERWPLFHFDWHRDTAVHFSVGYPF